MVHEWYGIYHQKIEATLRSSLQKRFYKANLTPSEGDFERAMAYALEIPGKRIRPILTLLMYEEISGSILSDNLMQTIAGIECLHIGDRIHDDLPEIDNDAFHAGKKSVWKEFDETTALLIGDSYHALGYELLAGSKDFRVVLEASAVSGDLGVARGKYLDRLETLQNISTKDMVRIIDEKVARFFGACLSIGCFLGQVSDQKYIDQIRWFGLLLGRAFQIQKDLTNFYGIDLPLGDTPKKQYAEGRGMVYFLGEQKTKDLLEELEISLLELTHHFRSPKFADLVQHIIHPKEFPLQKHDL